MPFFSCLPVKIAKIKPREILPRPDGQVTFQAHLPNIQRPRKVQPRPRALFPGFGGAAGKVIF